MLACLRAAPCRPLHPGVCRPYKSASSDPDIFYPHLYLVGPERVPQAELVTLEDISLPAIQTLVNRLALYAN